MAYPSVWQVYEGATSLLDIYLSQYSFIQVDSFAIISFFSA
jgi:hypothetical protein